MSPCKAFANQQKFAVASFMGLSSCCVTEQGMTKRQAGMSVLFRIIFLLMVVSRGSELGDRAWR